MPALNLILSTLHYLQKRSTELKAEHLEQVERTLTAYRPFVRSCRDALRSIRIAYEALSGRATISTNTHDDTERRKVQNRNAQTRLALRKRRDELRKLVKEQISQRDRDLQEALRISSLSNLASSGDAVLITYLGSTVSVKQPSTLSGSPTPLLEALYKSCYNAFRQISTCTWFVVLFCVVNSLGTALSIWWSLWKDDVSGGFTVGTFVTGAGCGAVNKLHSRHREDCRCRRSEQSSENSIEMGSPTAITTTDQEPTPEDAG